MSEVLIKNAAIIVTMDDQDTILYDHNILIDEGRIIAVNSNDYTETDEVEVIDGGRYIVYPGLINTHHHLYQTFTRNLPSVQKMELFPWLKTLYRIWRRITPDVVYYSAIVGMVELLKYGCTTCFDHHYVFPKRVSSELIDRQIEAARELGMRFHASRGSMSRGEKDGGLPPDDLVQTTEEILKDSQRLIESYHDPSPFSMCQVVLAPCSPFSVTPELMKESAALARSYGVRLHTHLAETKDEEDYCIDIYGKRPLSYLAGLGWSGSDVWYAHGIHFTDEEVDFLGKTETGVAHCPVSNMKLSSGVAKIPLMLDRKVPVGLAVDGSASNDCSNLLAEIKVAYLLHRLTCSETAPSGSQILRLATRGGASLLGRSDIGSLEVGKAADLFMIPRDLPENVGATADPAALPATVGIHHPVSMTMVNGKVVVRDGQLINVDERKLQEQALRCWQRFINEDMYDIG
ncbi:MAG: 8-oxoguanine deaminase [Firmicutes bacterium]|nr:8-oxoguanine deaminase [Bacillota bacterium]HXL03922.1 8-oxoguanine deaminase [Bacillota bacterium]